MKTKIALFIVMVCGCAALALLGGSVDSLIDKEVTKGWPNRAMVP